MKITTKDILNLIEKSHKIEVQVPRAGEADRIEATWFDPNINAEIPDYENDPAEEKDPAIIDSDLDSAGLVRLSDIQFGANQNNDGSVLLPDGRTIHFFEKTRI